MFSKCSNIFVQCGGRVFKQAIGFLPTDTNCDPLLADLFLHHYEADFTANLIYKKKHRLARSLNISFRYINGI